MNSYSESQALKLAMSCPEEFVNHNKKFLARIYPNGMRVDSSNYNPQDLWNCGCHMGRSFRAEINAGRSFRGGFFLVGHSGVGLMWVGLREGLYYG